jgi:hypothetical protein
MDKAMHDKLRWVFKNSTRLGPYLFDINEIDNGYQVKFEMADPSTVDLYAEYIDSGIRFEDDDIDDVVSSIYGFMKVDGAEAVQDEVAKDVINLNIFGEAIVY